MTNSFEYKPKGIDIRVNKGKKKLDPNQQVCDWAGCDQAWVGWRGKRKPFPCGN